jgi:hypothetical protein
MQSFSWTPEHSEALREQIVSSYCAPRIFI